jgi:hypothetical protein
MTDVVVPAREKYSGVVRHCVLLILRHMVPMGCEGTGVSTPALHPPRRRDGQLVAKLRGIHGRLTP